MSILFNYLIFPGFLFSASIGLLACWFDRKLSARVQYRVGPPWYQNFIDIIKLSGKEIIVPAQAQATFLFSPYIGCLSATLVATILGNNIFLKPSGFNGDLLVVIYLLIIPPVTLMLGAFASRNPLASVGAGREMKLVLAYELPFLLAVVAVIIKSAGVIQLSGIISQQTYFGSNIFSFSGFLSFLVVFFCIQAKMGIGLFDVSEADQELMSGAMIEYSGLPLAAFKLTKAVLLYSLPLFVVVLFLGKDLSPLFIFIKYMSLLIAIILIKNTNPRLRVDQVLRFFWSVPALLALAAVVLALLGL
ncbi:MAG: complex I subunit 1 family protein [Candidatus Omnitrophota bacterium]